MASIVGLLGHPDILRPWEQLTEIVRSGRTVLPGEGTVEPDNPVWVEFAKTMVPMVAPAITPLAEAVVAHRPGAIRVLDIAAGHGMFGIGIARLNPAARIVALDWAAVLEVAKENARAAGVLDRMEFTAGSAFDVEFGGPYDAVLLTNFLHHFDEETCVALLRKIRSALAPGGITATLEFVPNEDRVTPVMAAQFSMMMLGTTAKGDAYTLRDLERMHVAAGFSGIAPARSRSARRPSSSGRRKCDRRRRRAHADRTRKDAGGRALRPARSRTLRGARPGARLVPGSERNSRSANG